MYISQLRLLLRAEEYIIVRHHYRYRYRYMTVVYPLEVAIRVTRQASR